MEKVKINITKSDRIKEILEVISQGKVPRKIIFSCSGNIPLFADSRALKKIIQTAKDHKQELEFISSRKFVRDILKNHEFNVYSACPADYQELELKNINDLHQKKSLPIKNKQISRNLKDEDSSKKEESVIIEEKLEKSFEKHQIHNPGRKKTSRSAIFFILIFILFLLGVVLLWITPKATIVIKPKLSPIPVIQNIIISLPESELEEFDKDLPNISGVFIGTEVSGSESFTASGRKYDIENAHGKITLFNETDKPKFLVPSRLSTEDGLIFRFKEEATIPAKKGKKAGEKIVEVVADPFDDKKMAIGYRGNITAGTELFFPALREPLREFYYAKANKGPLVGGSTLTHYIVDEEDEENSAKFLEEVLKTRAIEALKKENSSRSLREKKKYVLLENNDLMVGDFSNFIFPKELINTEAQAFEVSGTLNLSGIVFDQSVVEEILLKKLKSVLDGRQELIELDGNSVDYSILEEENFAEKRYLKLSVKAIGVKSLNFNVNTRDLLEWKRKLKKQILGKSDSEAKSILINIPEIEQVINITISPFWSNQIPSILNRIEFKTDTLL